MIDVSPEGRLERRFNVAHDLLRLPRGARDDVNLFDLFSVRGDGGVLDFPESPQNGFGLSHPLPTAGFDGQSRCPPLAAGVRLFGLRERRPSVYHRRVSVSGKLGSGGAND
jgi:hypothetical protein